MKKYLPSIAMWLVFESVAVILWLALDNLFYLGLAESISRIGCPKSKRRSKTNERSL